MNNYDFYLFGRMYIDMVSKNNLEYDEEYELVCNLYEEFVNGPFDNPNTDLYSCITFFFNSKKLTHETTL